MIQENSIHSRYIIIGKILYNKEIESMPLGPGSRVLRVELIDGNDLGPALVSGNEIYN